MRGAWVVLVLALVGCTTLEPGGLVRVGDAGVPMDALVPMDARIDAGSPLDGGAVDAAARDAGEPTDARTPIDAPATPSDAGTDAGSPPRVLRVAAGGRHTCVVIEDGAELVCWGARDVGQLADMAPSGAAPFRTGIRGVADLCAGDDFTCVAREPIPDGGVGSDAGVEVEVEVECFGANDRRQLGAATGSGTFSASPVTVGRFDGPVELSCGARHACALDGNGELTCWGDNSENQADILLSTDPPAPTTLPPTVVDFGTSEPTRPSMGEGHSCVTLVRPSTRTAYCWGRSRATDGADNGGVGVLTPARLVVAGDTFTCALAADSDSLACLGDATTAGRGDLVTFIQGLALPFTHIDAGEQYACAATPTRLVCWGRTDDAQIGTALASPSVEDPVLPSGLRIADLSTGSGHACLVTSDGAVHCWGRNGDGQATGVMTTAPAPRDPVPVSLAGI